MHVNIICIYIYMEFSADIITSNGLLDSLSILFLLVIIHLNLETTGWQNAQLYLSTFVKA